MVLRGVDDPAADQIVFPAAGVTELLGLAQESLALAQRLFGSLAFRDVEGDAYHGGRALELEYPFREAEPALLAGLGHVLQLVGHRNRLPLRRCERRGWRRVLKSGMAVLEEAKGSSFLKVLAGDAQGRRFAVEIPVS